MALVICHDASMVCKINRSNAINHVNFIIPDQPIVASFPHFCNTSGPWDAYLEGLTPNATIHQSYTILEPVFGVPLHSRAVSNEFINPQNPIKYLFAEKSIKCCPQRFEQFQKGFCSLL